MDTSLQQRIQSADLTRTEKRIADYFLDHSESAAGSPSAAV